MEEWYQRHSDDQKWGKAAGKAKERGLQGGSRRLKRLTITGKVHGQEGNSDQTGAYPPLPGGFNSDQMGVGSKESDGNQTRLAKLSWSGY